MRETKPDRSLPRPEKANHLAGMVTAGEGEVAEEEDEVVEHLELEVMREKGRGRTREGINRGSEVTTRKWQPLAPFLRELYMIQASVIYRI